MSFSNSKANDALKRFSNSINSCISCHFGSLIIESSSIAYSEDKHLNHIKCLDGKDRIFIHAWRFVDDFIKSQQLFRDEYVKQNPEDVFNNLQEMLKEEITEGFEVLIEELKRDGKTFDAEEELKNNPKVKSFDTFFTLIILLFLFNRFITSWFSGGTFFDFVQYAAQFILLFSTIKLYYFHDSKNPKSYKI